MIRRRLAILLLRLGVLAIGVSPAPTIAQAAQAAQAEDSANSGARSAGHGEAPLANSAPPVVAPDREGYAFDQPRILAQQRLLGVAHGVSLLVSACMDMPAHIEATLAAYPPWRERQENTIALAQAELARHYFGARAGGAHWPDLLRALNLKTRLDIAAGSEELDAACATLPEALRRPRYQLQRQFELQGLLTEATVGIEAELRGAGCRKLLAGDARRLFDARYTAWHEINAPRMARAAEVLGTEWPVEGPADSFAEWEKELREDTRLRGSAGDCLAYSESLKRPQAALRRVFAPLSEVAP